MSCHEKRSFDGGVLDPLRCSLNSCDIQKTWRKEASLSQKLSTQITYVQKMSVDRAPHCITGTMLIVRNYCSVAATSVYSPAGLVAKRSMCLQQDSKEGAQINGPNTTTPEQEVEDHHPKSSLNGDDHTQSSSRHLTLDRHPDNN